MKNLLRICWLAIGVVAGLNSPSMAGDGNPLLFGLPKRSQPPLLDGIRGEGEWNGALVLECSPSQVARDGAELGWRNEEYSSEISVNNLIQSEGESPNEARTDADLSATIYQTWDDEAFYFLAQVRDNIHDDDGEGPPTAWWERDGLTLYLDLANSREQWASDFYGYHQAQFNIINYAAAPPGSSPETITWERLIDEGRTPTQAPEDIAGLEYAYRFAGNEFGGSADYVIEGKIPWATLLRHYTQTPLPQVGAEMGFSWIVVDPDGDSFYGGQLQSWGWADNPWDYSTWVLADETGALPPLRVNSPNGGDQWGVGSTHNIHWSADPEIPAVRIEYTTDNGSSWQEVAASTENDGVYAWTLPAEPAGTVLVRIADAADGDPVDTSDETFSIVRPPDYDISGSVDFDDFFLLADRFNTSAIDDPYPKPFIRIYDLDNSGRVGYGDFFIFADNFGREASDLVIPDPPGPGPGPFANAEASFELGDVTIGASVGPNQEFAFGIAARGLVGVKQFEIELEVIPSDVAWGISFTPAQGFISPGTVSEWFWDAETQTSGIRLKAGGGILGGPAVEGDLTLGTFALTTAPWFSAQTQATVRVTRLAVGSSSVEQDVFSAAELGLELGINREAVWHHRQVVLTEEPLDIFAQVPTSSLTLVQAEIHAGANDPPVATVELRDDGVAPDEEAGDQVYSGRWAGSEQVGQYSIDLVLEYSGGGQARRTGMDTFSIVHTIVSLPDLMLVSPEGLSTVRIPLLIEDHGSGYLSQGFLAAQFEVQMQGNGLEPSQPILSLEGTGLEGQSFLLDTLVAQTAGGWKLKGALASTTPLHLSASPGPGQQGLAYVELSLRPDNPAGILPVALNEALLEEDAAGVAIGCCGLVGLGRGDVDLNAHIESFDASLVLMHSVFMLNLDNPEDPLNDVIENRYEFTVPVAAAQMADVSGQLGVTAFDAALILQREVGLLTHFPSEEGYYRLWEPPAWWNPPTAPAAKPVATPAPRPLARVVSLGTPEEGPERVIVVPVEIDQMEGVLAGTLALSYEAQALQPVGVRATLLTQGYLLSDHAQGGQVWVSFAGPRWRAGSGAVMEVLFRRQGEGIGVLSLSQVQLNEEEVQVQEARLQTVSPVPRELALYPNYPNPFNPRTVIGYGLPAGGEVEVSVYNLAGQRVRRLWVGWQGVGVHQVEWDGRDEEGRVLSSGVYVCRLAVGQRVLVRKMLLVK